MNSIAGDARIELATTGLEAVVLPLHQSPSALYGRENHTGTLKT
jgi:hypothetical protein